MIGDATARLLGNPNGCAAQYRPVIRYQRRNCLPQCLVSALDCDTCWQGAGCKAERSMCRRILRTVLGNRLRCIVRH